MKIQILDKTKKRRFIEEVSYLGIEKIPYLLLKTGTDRIRAFSGSLSNEELMAFWRLFPIEGVGLYFGKDIVDKKTGRKEGRLSLDALHVLKEQIKKNVIKLNEEQEEEWFKGKNIELNEKQQEEYKDVEGFVSIQSYDGGDFVGTGKLSGDKKIVYSFLPKERRRKE